MMWTILFTYWLTDWFTYLFIYLLSILGNGTQCLQLAGKFLCHLNFSLSPKPLFLNVSNHLQKQIEINLMNGILVNLAGGSPSKLFCCLNITWDSDTASNYWSHFVQIFFSKVDPGKTINWTISWPWTLQKA
jgi:hypothetical protein